MSLASRLNEEHPVMEKKPDASLKTEIFFVALVLAIVAIDVVNRV